MKTFSIERNHLGFGFGFTIHSWFFTRGIPTTHYDYFYLRINFLLWTFVVRIIGYKKHGEAI